MRLISFIFLITILFMVNSAFAEQSCFTKFEIEIVSTDSTDPDGVIMGSSVSVPIIVNKATHKISGFDFKIAYNPQALALINIKSGLYLEQNNWENFEFELWPDDVTVDGTAYGVVSIHGSIVDNNNSETPPANLKPGDTLAVMNFLVSSDLTLECQSIPIKFLWGNCDDNIIYSWPVEKTYYSNNIINPNDSVITDNKPFPSFTGAIDECINSDFPVRRGFNKRAVDFVNGRVKIICIVDIDDRWDRGDINLNGIDYEVADAVLFTNYFIVGLYAFTINPDGQKAATDVNADGIPLTVEDYVYLIRIIVGDTLPYGNPSLIEHFVGTLQIENNENMITIGGEFDKAIGAVHLCFYAQGQTGVPYLTNAASHMDMRYGYYYDSLKILIYSMEHHAISPDLKNLVNIEYSGEKPVLAYASAGGHKSEKVDLEIIENDPFSIKIGRLEDQYLGHHSYLPVVQTGGNAQNHGFDFLISYNNSVLAFMGAYPDSTLFDIPGEYEWEYFTYSFDDRPCRGECPTGLIRFVGLANQKNGTHVPKSFNIADNTTLFTIDFLISSDMTLIGEFLPVSFFWKDCSDNAIRCNGAPGNPFGTRRQVAFLALSNRVFNVESRYDNIFYEITDKNCGFPTLNGTQEECYGRNNSNRLDYVPYIDFYNGGIKLPDWDIDDRGDINLNGIDYEVADAVIFTNYFIVGLYAFTINFEGQKAATDVNYDGIPLTVEDLVHFIRIINGDTLPFYSDIVAIEHFSGTLQIEDNENIITVSGEFEKEVGAVHLCFYAPGQFNAVSLTDVVRYMDLRYAQKDDSLKILIYSMEHHAISPDLKNLVNIEYSGEKPALAYVSVGGHKSEKVDLSIDYSTDTPNESILPEKFALYQNYPNPFNPYTEIKFSLPRSGNVTLEIFDITGRKVVTLISEKLSSGQHSIVWDGRDGAGKELSTGIYLYRISAEKYVDTKKMLLLK